MVITAGTAPEVIPLSFEIAGRTVNFNFSLNRRCALSEACADRCLLNHTLPDTPEMPDEERWQAWLEALDAGPTIRHVVFSEKEPTESPDFLRRALSEYHARPVQTRPQAVGMITHAVTLHRHIDWLSKTPLSWCYTSLDGMSETHHRGMRIWLPALNNLLLLKKSGGTGLIGVNTVLTATNTNSVIALGERLIDDGVDIWGLGAFLAPEDDGRVRTTLTVTEISQIIDRLVKSGLPDRLPMVFEMEPNVLESLSGRTIEQLDRGCWRVEYTVPGSKLRLAAISPRPGMWLRLRFDGQIIDKSDVMTIGVLEGRFGTYAPGVLADLFSKIRDGRENNPLPRDVATEVG